MSDYAVVMAAVASNRNVMGVAPFVMGPVLVETEPANGQSAVAGAWVRGMDPAIEGQHQHPAHQRDARGVRPERGRAAGGRTFADNMRLHVGDRVVDRFAQRFSADSQEPGRSVGGIAPVLPEFEVRGIFNVGYYEYNLSVIVTSLAGRAGSCTAWTKTKRARVDGDAPRPLPAQQRGARAGSRPLGPGLGQDLDAGKRRLVAVMVEKNVMFYMLFFIMIVAALCILERADHIRGAEDARDRHAQGAGRHRPAGEPGLSEPGCAGRCLRGPRRSTGWACWPWPIATSSCTS